MPILIAAIFVVGGLCLLDLLLTFGVIRRLREHTKMLTAEGISEMPGGIQTGGSPEAFTATTISGALITESVGLRAVAFFSSWCSACPERVPPFIEYLSRHGISHDDALAVVTADSNTSVPYLDQLSKVAQACIEPNNGEIAKAFKVTGFPTFFLLDADATVTASGFDPSTLPEPATV